MSTFIFFRNIDKLIYNHKKNINSSRKYISTHALSHV